MVLMEVLVGESARTCNVLPMVKKNILLVPNTLISATWLPPASNRQHPPRVARRKLEIPAPKSLYGCRWFAAFSVDVERAEHARTKSEPRVANMCSRRVGSALNWALVGF